MSASGKSSNRLYEYSRGLNGNGHGIYAEAGKRDAAEARRRERSRVEDIASRCKPKRP